MSGTTEDERGATGVASPGSAAHAVTALAQALVRIDTSNPPGGELAAARLIADRLGAHGAELCVQPFGEGRANLVARHRGSGLRPGLLLSGHLDTVPVDAVRWSVGPWSGDVRDGHLHGRGALDMKGAVAAMVIAFERVLQSGDLLGGDLVLGLTAGEETNSVGASMLCDAGLLDGVGAAVVGEPTDLGIGTAHRGVLWVRVQAAGRAGHGAQPAAGDNAVRALVDWLAPMTSIDQLVGADATHGAGSVSLNVIEGGRAPNMIPDAAHAVLDFRTVAPGDHRRILEALGARGDGVTLSVLRDAPPIATSPDQDVVVAALAATATANLPQRLRALPYVTDASVFVERLGVDAIVLGPGDETLAHTDDESVSVADLEAAATVYEALAFEFLS